MRIPYRSAPLLAALGLALAGCNKAADNGPPPAPTSQDLPQVTLEVKGMA